MSKAQGERESHTTLRNGYKKVIFSSLGLCGKVVRVRTKERDEQLLFAA